MIDRVINIVDQVQYVMTGMKKRIIRSVIGISIRSVIVSGEFEIQQTMPENIGWMIDAGAFKHSPRAQFI